MVHDVLLCVVGPSLRGAYLTGLMSCAMPGPQRGCHSVGSYTIGVVGDKTSNREQPSITELRAGDFCKNVLLNNSRSTAHQLSKL